MNFGIFTMLCNHHHHLIQEYFHYSKKEKPYLSAVEYSKDLHIMMLSMYLSVCVLPQWLHIFHFIMGIFRKDSVLVACPGICSVFELAMDREAFLWLMLYKWSGESTVRGGGGAEQRL